MATFVEGLGMLDLTDYFREKKDEAQELFDSSYCVEGGQVLVDMFKLNRCRQLCITQLRNPDLPLKFRIQFYIYLSAEQENQTALYYLARGLVYARVLAMRDPSGAVLKEYIQGQIIYIVQHPPGEAPEETVQIARGEGGGFMNSGAERSENDEVGMVNEGQSESSRNCEDMDIESSV